MAAKDYFLITDVASGGVNTQDDPRELADNESPEILNMDIVKKGRVTSRTGYEEWGSVAGPLTTGFRGLLRYNRTFGANSGLFLLSFNADGNSYKSTNAAPTPASIGSYGTDSGAVRGIVFDNMAIWGNGLAANTIQKWEGTGNSSNLGGTPPDSKIFGIVNNSLLAVPSGGPQSIQWCDVGDPEDWTGGIASNTAVPTREGGDVTAIVESNDQPMILAEFSKHMADMTFDANDIISLFAFKEKIDSSGGCGATGSVQIATNPLGEQVFYLSAREGFQSFGAIERFPDKRSPSEIGFKIKPTTDRINFDSGDAINSAFHKKKYICNVPFETATKNNYAFVYNTRLVAWTVYNGWNFGDIAVMEDTFGRDQLYAASNSNGTIFKFNNGFSDNGFGYSRIYRSRTWDFGNRVRTDWIDFTGSKVQGQDVFIDITIDNQTEKYKITDKNLVQATGGGYIADNWVGDNYAGGGEFLQATPMFKFKGRAKVTTKQEGEEVSFRTHNTANGAGYSLESYGIKIGPVSDQVARNVISGGSGYLERVT